MAAPSPTEVRASLRPTRSRKVASRDAARRRSTRSAADERPRSSRPCGDANLVRDMPRAFARAFMRRTKADTLPDPSIARASAASFAEPSSNPASRSRTDTSFTGPEAEGRPHAVVVATEYRVRMHSDHPVEASLLLLQDEQRGHELRQAGHRPSLVGRLSEEHLPGVEVHEDRCRRLHARRGDRVPRRGQAWRRTVTVSRSVAPAWAEASPEVRASRTQRPG